MAVDRGPTRASAMRTCLIPVPFLLWLPLSLACCALPAADALPDWMRALQPQSDSWKKSKQELVFNNQAEPETLDPTIMKGVLESRIGIALFEGLVGYDPKTLEARPGVATSWTVSDDHLVYTFNLRPDACWSDGSPLTARDFARSWQRAITPATAAEYVYQFYPIVGAEDFFLGKLSDFSKVGIEVVDDHTIRTRLRAPCPYFLDLVAFTTLMPVPVDRVQKFGERWVLPENILGNGPFKLASWERGKGIEMVPNEHYWDRAHVRLTKITARPYDKDEIAYQLYLDNKLDWIPSVPVAKIDEIKRNPDFYAYPFLGSGFYRFNCTKPPFNDARVRKAFSLAIDRKTITEHVLRAGEVPATWFVPDIGPKVGGYRHVKGLAEDRELARTLLAECSYPAPGRPSFKTKPFPPVELLYNTSENNKAIAEAIVSQWKDALGVTVTLRNSEWKVYLADMDALKFDVCRGSWVGDYNDANTFLDMFVTNGGNNRTGWSNTDYDRLVGESQREGDPAKRLVLLQRLERILVEEQFPIMPIYIYVNKGMLRERVHGWYDNVRDLHPFQYMWIEE
ncbi:MAG: peptide ABC transporter substrate-binding protein [Planctomycetes bacterium]|nr:peptide ABC transporter substrate-binding protein [Planctomycetota bacterium]